MATEAPAAAEVDEQALTGSGGDAVPKSPTHETDTPHETEDDNIHQEEEEGNGDETEKLLPNGFTMVGLDKDIYSLIFTSNPMGPAFWFGMIVCLFQGGIVWLVFYDLIDWGDSSNPLRIPAGNDVSVTLAQACLMILMSQDSMDLMEGLEFLTDGYHKEVLDVCPHATFFKWFLAGVCHTIVGMIIAADVFVLLMQETTVFGLGVDFVAMNKFFAMIDNIAYKIGSRGVFSPQVRKECRNVGNVKVRRREHYTWSRRFRDVLLMGTVLTGYGILTHRQLRGDYLCNSIYIQFGDVFNPGIGEISGMFDTLEGLAMHDSRVIYEERSGGEFRIAYCQDMKRWTMTPYVDEKFEPCGSPEVEVLARSGVTDAYDILTTKDTWHVNSVRYGSGFNPFTQFTMECNECSSKCNKAGGVCDKHENCVCKEGFYGLNCELENPCPMMQVNFQTEMFPPFVGEYDVPYQYHMLTYADGSEATAKLKGSIQVEYRPVYFATTKDAAFLLLFSGRRWLLYGYGLEYGGKEVYVDHLARNDFNMINTTYAPFYASSPMDVDTPSDGPTPAGLDWFYVTRKFDGGPRDVGDDDTPINYRTSWWVEENQPLRTRLQCGFCTPQLNPCKNYGICDESTFKCKCLKEVGSLCEYELKCSDTDFFDPSKIIGCPYNATCGRDGACVGCPEGYSGKTCQVESLCANVENFTTFPLRDCLNDGLCDEGSGVCSCPDPFYGPLCQFS